jgi:hypothetical protein
MIDRCEFVYVTSIVFALHATVASFGHLLDTFLLFIGSIKVSIRTLVVCGAHSAREDGVQ